MKVSKKEILELIDNMNIYTLEVGEYNYDVVIDKYDFQKKQKDYSKIRKNN